jgi:hypothetical protein
MEMIINQDMVNHSTSKAIFQDSGKLTGNLDNYDLKIDQITHHS